MAFRQGDIERSAQQAEAPLIDIPLTELNAYESGSIQDTVCKAGGAAKRPPSPIGDKLSAGLLARPRK